MATATFYTFAKRKNSTLQPTGTGTNYDIQLKSGTSLISPTFLLEYAGRPTFNYVDFEGRKYFINDIASVRNNLWELSCNEDFLGTWKNDIGSTTAVILYATGGSDDIIDQRIGIKNGLDVRSEAVIATGDFTGFTYSSEGIAIISVTGVGTFGNYLINSDDVPNLLKNINAWDLSSIADVATGFQQFIRGGDAPGNLRSAIYIPVILSTTANFGNPEQIYLGRYPCTDLGNNAINGRKVNNPFLYANATVPIPWKYNDWRRNVPYTKVFLYLPLFGVISIPSSDIINESGLSVLYSINMLGGDVACQVRGSDSSRVITTASGNIAMQTPYGSANISGSKVASAIGVAAGAIASVAAGVVTGGAATVVLGSGLAASAGGLISAMGGETSGGGGLSGSAVTGLDLGIKCTTISRDLSDSQASLDPVIGKPVMAKHTINTYTGFVQTDGMEVTGNMLDQERETINNMCNGGIYYE